MNLRVTTRALKTIQKKVWAPAKFWALTWPNSDFNRVRRRDLIIKSGLLLTALSITPSKAWSSVGLLATGTEVPGFDLPFQPARTGP